MGNHEYCTECGASDFHDGRPCNPDRLAKNKVQKELDDARHASLVSVMRSSLDKAGIPYEIDQYGNATVRPSSFRI